MQKIFMTEFIIRSLKKELADRFQSMIRLLLFYKGYLLKDGSVFDGTKDKPAIFPLKRLIMGWQMVFHFEGWGKIKSLFHQASLFYSNKSRKNSTQQRLVLK
jgi:hypothetical protein